MDLHNSKVNLPGLNVFVACTVADVWLQMFRVVCGGNKRLCTVTWQG